MALFLQDVFNGIRDELLDATKDELERRSPVRTGTLRNSWYRRTNSVVSDAVYAGEVDRKQPFVDESVDAAISRVVDFNLPLRGGGYAPARGRVASSSDILGGGKD